MHVIGTGRRGCRTAVVLATLLAMAGCGREPTPSAGGETPGAGEPTAGAGAAAPTAAVTAGGDAAARADAMLARAASWPAVEGRWDHGGEASTWTARFEGGELRLLEERVGDGPGARTNRYFYEAGAPWWYAGEAAPAGAAGGGPGAQGASVPVVVEFRGEEVLRGVSREHHGEKKLAPETVAAIRRRALALAGAAQDEWSATQAR